MIRFLRFSLRSLVACLLAGPLCLSAQAVRAGDHARGEDKWINDYDPKVAQDDAGRSHDRHSDQDRARDALRQGRVVPLNKILEKVDRDYSGKVIQVELEDHGRQLYYEVKLLGDNGRLVELRYDAHEATLLNAQDSDILAARRK